MLKLTPLQVYNDLFDAPNRSLSCSDAQLTQPVAEVRTLSLRPSKWPYGANLATENGTAIHASRPGSGNEKSSDTYASMHASCRTSSTTICDLNDKFIKNSFHPGKMRLIPVYDDCIIWEHCIQLHLSCTSHRPLTINTSQIAPRTRPGCFIATKRPNCSICTSSRFCSHNLEVSSAALHLPCRSATRKLKFFNALCSFPSHLSSSSQVNCL